MSICANVAVVGATNDVGLVVDCGAASRAKLGSAEFDPVCAFGGSAIVEVVFSSCNEIII